MSTEKIVTYWLCPSEPAREKLAGIIGDLARRFDAVTFEPHVTLYVTNARGENSGAVLQKIAPTTARYRLFVSGINHSDKFTKTLFIQFAPDAALSHLSEQLRRASASQNDYELNPHLSLIYANLDQETKRQLAASVTVPFTGIEFDSVKAVLSPAQITSREDVEAWRVVAERRLTG